VRGRSTLTYRVMCADSISYQPVTSREKFNNLTRGRSAYNITARLNIISTSKIKFYAPNSAIVVELAWVQGPFERNGTNFVDPTNERGD